MRTTITCISALCALATAGAAELRLSGPYNHDNLSIYLVHGTDRIQKKYLTLTEAIAQHKVVVHETGDVNRLMVENLAGEDVFIQSGEIVKGGKQDRVLQDDIILPTASGKVAVNAFCVEQGRWTQRGSEKVQAFASSPSAIASPGMKRAVKEKANQQEVWAEVASAQARLSRNLGAPVKAAESESSLQLTMESPKVRQSAESFTRALGNLAAVHRDALGYVMTVNGQVTGSDVYASHDLFVRVWPKLLGSAAVEAIGAPRIPGAARTVPMEEVRSAATGYGARVRDDRKVNARTSAVKADLPNGIVFETRDANAPAVPLHRSYVSK